MIVSNHGIGAGRCSEEESFAAKSERLEKEITALANAVALLEEVVAIAPSVYDSEAERGLALYLGAAKISEITRKGALEQLRKLMEHTAAIERTMANA